MSERRILTNYLLPTMLQAVVIAWITAVLRQSGVETGYASGIGIALIVIIGISSACWGTVYQCRCNGKHVTDVLKDFIHVRQPIKVYLLVIVFLLIDFGGVIVSGGFRTESLWLPILLFLKAIAFGGIEEIGWRYSFQPALEDRLTYMAATLLTFICWGIWHLLFFYVDGSFPAVDLLSFLLGLFVNCFILSALYAYSGSLWICVMTHALINALSQIAINGSAVMMDDTVVTIDDVSVINVAGKVICVVLAVGLHRKVTKVLDDE